VGCVTGSCQAHDLANATWRAAEPPRRIAQHCRPEMLAAVAELVTLPVDVLVTVGTPATSAPSRRRQAGGAAQTIGARPDATRHRVKSDESGPGQFAWRGGSSVRTARRRSGSSGAQPTRRPRGSIRSGESRRSGRPLRHQYTAELYAQDSHHCRGAGSIRVRGERASRPHSGSPFHRISVPRSPSGSSNPTRWQACVSRDGGFRTAQRYLA